MKFSRRQFESAREALLGPLSGSLLEIVFNLGFQRQTVGLKSEAIALGREIGWLEAGGPRLTKLGLFVSDSIREYQFWLRRDRELPFEGAANHLRAQHFHAKSVLEIGCGMGCNLMSLQGIAKRLVGVEPITVYSQIGSILREREGLAEIEVRVGGCPTLPCPNAEFDIALCVTAHQYLDLIPAIHDIKRILKPGGEVLIIGGTLPSFVKSSGMLRRPPKASEILTIVNTLSYETFSRRALSRKSDWATANPIYPRATAMIRWLRAAGFEVVLPFAHIPPETCFRAIKKA